MRDCDFAAGGIVAEKTPYERYLHADKILSFRKKTMNSCVTGREIFRECSRRLS